MKGRYLGRAMHEEQTKMQGATSPSLSANDLRGGHFERIPRCFHRTFQRNLWATQPPPKKQHQKKHFFVQCSKRKTFHNTCSGIPLSSLPRLGHLASECCPRFVSVNSKHISIRKLSYFLLERFASFLGARREALHKVLLVMFKGAYHKLPCVQATRFSGRVAPRLAGRRP